MEITGFKTIVLVNEYTLSQFDMNDIHYDEKVYNYLLEKEEQLREEVLEKCNKIGVEKIKHSGILIHWYYDTIEKGRVLWLFPFNKKSREYLINGRIKSTFDIECTDEQYNKLLNN